MRLRRGASIFTVCVSIASLACLAQTVLSLTHHQMNTQGFYAIEDILYPSNNMFDIPTLRIDRQARNLVVPFSAYGT